MSKIDYLTKNQSERLLQVIRNKKHKAATLLMLDCGLRVSECTRLKFSDFDFKRRSLRIQSLKKRNKQETREVPISDRCYIALSAYISSLSKEEVDKGILFPGNGNRTYSTRHSINRLCERIRKKYPEFAGLHPHTLRHTCATQLLASGAELHEVKTILGHKKYDTTLIYTHIPQETLRERIDKMTSQSSSRFGKVKQFFFPVRKPGIINIRDRHGISSPTIGREEEVKALCSLIDRGINVLLLGGAGIGKTHLIDMVSGMEGRKVLRFDDLSEIKKTLLNTLLYLYQNDLSHVKELVYGQYDLEALKVHLQRDSVKNLCKEIIRVVPKQAYVIVVDNCDRLTPKGMKVLEELKDHFVVLAGAREIPIKYSSFAWNFEVMRLKRLSRCNTIELVTRLSQDIEIKEYDLFRNHIYEQSDGNPRVICELVERYRKEPVIDAKTIRGITHVGNLKEYDFSPMLIVILAIISTLRFMSSELDNDSLRFIGGASILLLIVLRNMFPFTKRKRL